MKKALLLFCNLLIIFGCTEKFDDSTLWQSIYSIENRLSAVEVIVNAYEKKLYIESVKHTDKGYVIIFSDGSTATIVNGTDGSDGADGDTYIDSVVVGSEYVVFTLTDGESFTIPFYATLSIDFDSEDVLAMVPGQLRKIHYSITSQSEEIEIEVLSSADIKASIDFIDADKKEGYVCIMPTSAPEILYSKVVVIVSDGSKVIMRRFSFSDTGMDIYDNSEKTIESDGGALELEFVSSVEYEVIIPEEALNWISYETNATRSELSKECIVLNLEKNTGYARETYVTVRCPHDESLSVNFHVYQKPDREFVQKNDREVLEDLYVALGRNISLTNWGTNAPLEDWYGIVVDEMSERVIGVQLDNCEGAIPPSIGNLTELKELNLDQCVITSLPSEIGCLQNLESLIICGKYNNDRNLHSLPAEFCNLVSLRHLNLRNNNISELPDITKLVNLEYIDLGFNETLNGNILELIAGLKELRSLNLYYDRNVTGTLERLPELTKLETVDLGLTKVSGTIPANIGNLTMLKYFSVMDTKVSGELPESMSRLKNVISLGLHGTKISGILPEWLGELENLETLLLEFTDVSGCIPNSLTKLEKLKSVSLIGTNISGEIPVGLGNMPALRSLHLSDCKLTGGLSEDIVNIEDLWLFNNKLSGDIPEGIINSEKWRNNWGLIAVGNNFNLEGLTFPGPDFTMDVDILDDRKFRIADEYVKNKYTILFQWSAYCPYLDAAVELLKTIHNKYSAQGLKIIGRTYMETSSKNKIIELSMPWETYYSQQLDYPAYIAPTITVIDNSGMVVFSDVIQDRFELEDFLDREYAN